MLGNIIRKLPFFRGKKRIARLLFHNKISSAANVVVKGKYDCSYLLPNIKESLAFEVFTEGIYEWDTHDFLMNQLPSGATLLDLGANIGSVTVPLCKRRNDIRAICVEAAPWVFDYLKKNIELNKLENVTILNKALYDEDDQEFEFFSPKDQFGKGSLSPVFTKDAVKITSITVDTMLKQLGIDKVDLIKIDVEGYEGFVFRGAKNLLMRIDAPDILFEFADWAENLANGIKAGSAQDFLRSLGYKIHIFENNKISSPLAETLTEGNLMLFASKRI